MGENQAVWCAAIALIHGPEACAFAARLAMEASAKAEDLAREHDWGGDRMNAFRHSYWLGLMTLNGFTYGETIGLGVAHELDGDKKGETWGSRESDADLHNNRVGAQIGLDIRASRRSLLARVSVGASEKERAELEANLVYLAGGPVEDHKADYGRRIGDLYLRFVEPPR